MLYLWFTYGLPMVYHDFTHSLAMERSWIWKMTTCHCSHYKLGANKKPKDYQRSPHFFDLGGFDNHHLPPVEVM